MRKSGIIITILLLIAVLALMMASAGLLPVPFLKAGETSSIPQVNLPFSTSLENETDHVAEHRPKLTVHTQHGQIIVKGANVDQIEVHMHVQTKATTALRAQELMNGVSLDIRTTADTTVLEVQAPRTHNNEMARADSTISVPVETELDLKTGLGQVEVTNVQGSVRALSQLGAIKLEDVEGDAYLETALGNIEISNSVFEKELVALTHLGDIHIQASLAQSNILESSLGDLTLLLSPDESYVLEGKLSLGSINIMVPFKGQQSRERIQGVIGEGKQRGSINVDLSLGSLELKN